MSVKASAVCTFFNLAKSATTKSNPKDLKNINQTKLCVSGYSEQFCDLLKLRVD